MRRPFRSVSCGLSALTLLVPAPALGHAGERMVLLTMPTGHYIAGAALVVGITALAGALLPRLPQLRAHRILSLGAPQAASGSWLAFATMCMLIAVGWLGPRDPLGNLLPLTVWTLIWVGLTMACMLLGDLWRGIDPWTGPVRAARRLLGLEGSVGLTRLGSWPAGIGLLGFAWFEIVSLAPADPSVLARTVLVYWLSIFGLAVLEGENWLRRGEALTLYFATVARIAPLWMEHYGGRLCLMAGPPGAQIVAMRPLPASTCAFVALVLASVTFDGLHETFWWVARLGLNPLEYPGRSAVVVSNTLGLVAAWFLTGATILATVMLGRRLAGAHGGFRREARTALMAFLPIAAGYHAAHYLVAFLTGARYAVAALNDPFGSGWSLLGLPDHWVSLAFLNDPASVAAIWNVQFTIILCAHLLAVVVGYRLTPPRPPVAHLPMAALMVLYTVFGLWLLSSPVAA